MTVLHLVRHGQSTWNADGRVLGQTVGVPLTDLGREQASAAGALLAAASPDVLVTSDLLRAAQTAQIIGAATGLAPRSEPALREQGLGAMEGRLAADLVAEPTPPGRHVSDVRWGGGESIADVHARVGSYLAGLLRDPPGRSVVLVTHAHAIRVALAWLAGRPPSAVEWVDVPHGGITTVQATSLSGGAGG